MVREGLDIRALFGFMSRRPSSTRAWMRSAFAAAGVGLSAGSWPVFGQRARGERTTDLPTRSVEVWMICTSRIFCTPRNRWSELR
jgi:hypothetical protein